MIALTAIHDVMYYRYPRKKNIFKLTELEITLKVSYLTRFSGCPLRLHRWKTAAAFSPRVLPSHADISK